MKKEPVIAIFDIGKTNKKLFLFDQHYQIVFERSTQFEETLDEDGFPCEKLENLRQFVSDSLAEVFIQPGFELKGINFSAYGASLVYLDKEGKELTPLYSYLKPYPEELKTQFYETYGGEEAFCLRTASPVLGSLNSGMQLYRIKYENPALFSKIKYALHLPQYMSQLVSGKYYADITSIGCHTNLWDFQKNEYHEWVTKEGIFEKLPPPVSCHTFLHVSFPGAHCGTGVGLHDSSAALIPYMESFQEPFILLSTGTWCISINPFNSSPLTAGELKQDCLSFLNYRGKAVKASRLFAGHEHEQQLKRISAHFHKKSAWFKDVCFDAAMADRLEKKNDINMQKSDPATLLTTSIFERRKLEDFNSAEEAYHQLMLDLVTQQLISTQLVLKGSLVKRIFVDGGFSKNAIYMNLMARSFPQLEVYAASMAQATAVGTAMVLHSSWNSAPFPTNVIKLKLYTNTHQEVI
jgi:sugar (pentulose or hexulose) kinase